MPIPQIPNVPYPNSGAEYALLIGGLLIWAMVSTGLFLYFKFGGEKNVTNGTDKTNYGQIREQLAQDKIRIDRAERDISELRDGLSKSKSEQRDSVSKIESTQSKAIIEIMSILGELRGILDSQRRKNV